MKIIIKINKKIFSHLKNTIVTMKMLLILIETNTLIKICINNFNQIQKYFKEECHLVQ